ncbi:hypothetical protein MYX74_005222, partial [Escherichia coli]|nr:hypothetical protein [Escherichia coli]
GACGNNRTNRGGFQFAAARLPWFMTTRSYSGLMLIAAHIFLVGLPIAFIARRRDRARAQKFAA